MQNKEMYEFKASKRVIRGQKTASEVIGITQPTLSKILNKKILTFVGIFFIRNSNNFQKKLQKKREKEYMKK